MAYLMGIDLGTSSLKVVIIDEEGNRKIQCAEGYKFDSPFSGFAEQDVAVWWGTCCRTVRKALSLLDDSPSEIVGLGFSGQMHGAVFLDKDLVPIRPAILHYDARSGEQVKRINSVLGVDVIKNLVLNPIYTGFLLPSLMWVRENEPMNYSKIRHVLLPKDYLKFMFTGKVTSDYSDASASLVFDIENLRWSEKVLGLLDIPADIFPDCSETSCAIGKITKRAADATGLTEGTIVVNGGADQIMQAIGNGAVKLGMATVNIGSSGQVCFQSNRPVKNPRLSTNTFCGHEKGKWITMGATMSAGLSLKWFTSLFGNADYDELDYEVGQIEPGSGGIIFLPYLNGERTPHINPNLSGLFVGINAETNKYQMARSVMEGVAYSLMQCIEVCGELGLTSTELIASGGGASSAVWLQIQADIYGIPLKVSTFPQQAGLGAAIAAGVGVGIYQSIEEGCNRVVKYHDQTYLPNKECHNMYQEYYKLFKETYEASKSVIEKVTLLGRKKHKSFN